MSLASEVIARISAQRLIELTNNIGTETVIDSDRLGKACDDSIAEFERVTGIAFDENNHVHIATCVKGVIYFLEDYKSRDVAIVNARQKVFYTSLEKIKEMRYFTPKTNSPLTPTKQRQGSRPDMDRSKTVFLQQRRSSNVSEFLEET